MSRFSRSVVLLALALVGMTAEKALGQYSKLAAPFGVGGDSFYENIGIGWGFNGPNFSFNNGGAAPPPFGGHAPGADGSFGFGGGGNNLGFHFNMTAGQGSSRTFTSQTPMIVVPNGSPGFLFDGRQRPFVTGVIPVVGAGAALTPPTPAPHVVSPLAERLSRLRAEQALQAASASDAAARSKDAQGEPAASSSVPAAPMKDDPPLILGSP